MCDYGRIECQHSIKLSRNLQQSSYQSIDSPAIDLQCQHLIKLSHNLQQSSYQSI